MTKLTTSTKLTATILGLLGAVALVVSQVAQGREVQLTPITDSLESGILGPTELPGFTSVQCPSLRTDATDWAGADGASTARLRANGFVMGIRESLYASGADARVTSSVKHFRTRGGANAELTQEVAMAFAPNSAAVRDEPGLRGYRFSTGHDAVELVAFTVGANEYQLRLIAHGSRRSSELEARLLASARHLYHRVGGEG
jgi:hypothetical protein